MRQSARAVLTVCVLITLTSTFAWAGVIPGRWEKVQAEKPGTGLFVFLTSGERLEASLREVTADSLMVTVNGEERTLPKSAINKVTTAERRTGPLWNGPLIGGIIGGALSAIALAALGDDANSEDWVQVPIFAGIGAGIGLGIDAAVQNRVTLYEAPKTTP